jgi:hypothetical protein
MEIKQREKIETDRKNIKSKLALKWRYGIVQTKQTKQEKQELKKMITSDIFFDLFPNWCGARMFR